MSCNQDADGVKVKKVVFAPLAYHVDQHQRFLVVQRNGTMELVRQHVHYVTVGFAVQMEYVNLVDATVFWDFMGKIVRRGAVSIRRNKTILYKQFPFGRMSMSLIFKGPTLDV